MTPAASVRELRRGDVWWAELADASGSGAGFRRPVVVVSSDAFNASRIATVVVVALTSNLRLAEAPGNVRIRGREAGLPKDSVANVSQILTVDREALTEPAGHLRSATLQRVEAGLRLALEL